MVRPVKFRVRDGIAIVTLDRPPVNALDAATRAGLGAIFSRIAERADVAAVLLVATGDMFSAGADISEFGRAPADAPTLAQLCTQIEDCTLPVVVGIQGRALGGGAELALAAHYRVGESTAMIGLPEVTLGLIPGAGGTQRLPRLIGAEAALNMMITAQSADAGLAQRFGLLDAVVDAPVIDGGYAFTKALVAAGQGPRPTSGRRHHLADGRAYTAILAKARAALDGNPQYAPHRIIDCVEGAALLPFAAGLAQEADAFDSCLRHPQSVAFRHIFKAERRATPLLLTREGASFKPVDPAGLAILNRLRPVWHAAAEALVADDLSKDDIGRIMVDYGFRKGPFGMRDGGGPTGKAGYVQQAMIGALMAEGARIIESGLARTSADVDAIAVHGMGFPRRHGGPMRATQSLGLLHMRRALAPFAQDNAIWQTPALVDEAIKYADGFDALPARDFSPE